MAPYRFRIEDPPRSASSIVQRVAWLPVATAVAVVALGVAAGVGAGHIERPEAILLGSASVVALAISAAVMVPTTRLLQRELRERRQAERVLRDSEAVFRQLAENVREVFYLCEWPRGGLIFISPAFSRLWGRSEGAGFSFRNQWIAAIREEDRERVARAWDEGAALGRFDVEYRIVRSDGEERWVHDRAFPVRDRSGHVFRIAGIAEDITERSRSELHFRDLIETAPDAMVFIDHSGRIVLVNGQTEALFGYDRDDLEGRPVELLMPERYRQRHRRHRDAFAAAPRLRPMGSGLELHGCRKDGSEFPIEISLSPLDTPDGPLVSAAVRDMTVTRAAQRELARQRDALESANSELARTNAELEQFASAASHDLREPLRKMISFAELLRGDLGCELPARAEEDLSFITDAASRMRKLVEDLLVLARTGTSEMTPRTVSLERCVDDALAALALQVAETGAQIGRDPLPEVTGDPTLLQGLYQNLLSNALKFTDGAPPRIHLTAEPAEGSWLLGVRDHGIGIDPERTEEIFHPFRRLHTREDYPGSGIGLAIVRKAVERHGGRIWVETAPGQGAHFRFLLPAPRERAA